MIRIRRSEDRGHADHGWLDTYHTFSFAHYHDERHMGFSHLRVVNQDRVAPGQGFGTHGHRNMEIVSYVLDGVLEHKDSMGNGSTMRPGEVQLMSAGTGVTHSEFNGSADDPVHFLQMWILPEREETMPRYEQKAFTEEERADRLRLVVSPDGADGSLTILQDARLYVGLLSPKASFEHEFADGRGGWLHVARGRIRVGDVELGPGDGAAILDERSVAIAGIEDADVVLWDLEA
jgi:redox-sensitive bicupin YhaK (pirin superfamily)